jgi:hypothetical protein
LLVHRVNQPVNGGTTLVCVHFPAPLPQGGQQDPCHMSGSFAGVTAGWSRSTLRHRTWSPFEP